MVKPVKKSFQKSDYIVHGLYFFFYGIVKYVPSPLGDILRYWISKPFIHKMGKVRLYEGVTLWYPYRIQFGNDVSLNEWVYISGFGGVAIEEGVRIGHRTSIITSDHDISDASVPVKDSGLFAAPVTIKKNAWIGANVTVLKGVTIGEGAVVAAGALVNKDVPDFAVVAGVPARVLSQRKAISQNLAHSPVVTARPEKDMDGL